MDGLALLGAILLLVGVSERTVVVLRSLKMLSFISGVGWIVVAFVVGVVYCLAIQSNLAGQALVLVPALAEHSDRLTGLSGQIITGITVGALTGPLHELVDRLRAAAGKPST